MKMNWEKWIKKWNPCRAAVDWFWSQEERRVAEGIKKLPHYSWAIWAIPRLLKNRNNRLRFAIYSASLVLPIFEKKYREDKSPRQAIQIAKKCLKSDTKQNRKVAAYAAHAAAYAADAAHAAYVAADAAHAAYAAANAADAAYAADAAHAAHAAAYAAHAAYAAADAAIRVKIINYGIKLLKED
jgi:hypothetical protein